MERSIIKKTRQKSKKDLLIISLQKEIHDMKQSHEDKIREYETKIQDINNKNYFKLKFLEDKLLKGNTERFIEYYHKLTKLLDSIDELRILYLM
jgi:hypothetical protein